MRNMIPLITLLVLLAGERLAVAQARPDSSEGTTIVFFEGQRSEVSAAWPDPDDLWLQPADLRRASGFEWKDEGPCRDGVCYPVPVERRAHLVLEDGGNTWISLSELARLQDRASAFDRGHRSWCFGPMPTPAPVAGKRCVAPDFTLPDWKGTSVSLSDFAGSKVLIITWASW